MAMTAELVLVRRPRSDRGWRRRDGVRARDGRHFQTNLVVRHGGTNSQTMFVCGAFCGACGLLPRYVLRGRRNLAPRSGWRASLVKTFGTRALLFNKVSHLPLMPVNVLALRAGQSLKLFQVSPSRGCIPAQRVAAAQVARSCSHYGRSRTTFTAVMPHASRVCEPAGRAWVDNAATHSL